MCLALFCACTTAFAQKRGEPDIDVEQLRKLQFAQLAISNLYVDSVDQKKLVEDAINGMLSKLDPHSSYTNAEETRKLNEPLEGNFEGIGVQFNMLNDTLVVIQPTAKGPSERAGIVAGDRIVSVDGRPHRRREDGPRQHHAPASRTEKLQSGARRGASRRESAPIV